MDIDDELERAQPFSWPLDTPSQLGSLCDPDFALDPWLAANVRECSAGVLGVANESDLVFVGRSMDSIRGYLQGALTRTQYAESIHWLNVSLYGVSLKSIRQRGIAYMGALKRHLQSLGLDPKRILMNPRQVTFIDVVDQGGTYESIFNFLKVWALEERIDWPGVKRKLRFVAVLSKSDPSPNSCLWSHDADWTTQMGKAIVNITIDRDFWCYIANTQPKMTSSVPIKRWLKDEVYQPQYDEERLRALNEMRALYLLGCTKIEKRQLAKSLSLIPLRSQFQRALVLALRGKSHAH